MPRLAKNYFLNFYGGEPLLNFDLIEKTLSLLEDKNRGLKKRGSYSLTTNGTLLTEKIIHFLNQHRFSIVLSFDGLAQEQQRKKGTFESTISLIKKILKSPEIKIQVNSVFTPQSVHALSESIKLAIDLGLPEINYSLSILEPWDRISLLSLKDEIRELRKILVAHYRRKRVIPVMDFREKPGRGVFYCAAGKDRLAVTPDEEVWGCQLFPEYFKVRKNSAEFKKFFFGTLDNFIANYKNIYTRIYRNYAWLSTDNYSTAAMDCYLCPELEDCQICPVNAAFSGSPLAKIPDYVCEIQRIKAEEKNKFRDEIAFQRSLKS